MKKNIAVLYFLILTSPLYAIEKDDCIDPQKLYACKKITNISANNFANTSVNHSTNKINTVGTGDDVDLSNFKNHSNNINYDSSSNNIRSGQWTPNQWSIIPSIGYSSYQSKMLYNRDSNIPLARLGVNYIWKEVYKASLIGVELGIQNGNTMRVHAPKSCACSASEVCEGSPLPIQSTISPLLDLLVTLKTFKNSKGLPHLIVKGGVAYRKWQFNDRDNINNRSALAGETQFGLEYLVTNRMSVNLVYQQIYGSGSKIINDSISDSFYARGMPSQYGILIGFNYNV